VYDGAVQQHAADGVACMKEQTHMSNDRTTEILNYLTAISRDVGELRRDVGELRVEVKQINTRLDQIESRLTQLEARLTSIEREQRLQGKRLDRIEGISLIMRSDVSELQDRVSDFESKQT
jgi:chromosome segregation ATPase